MWQYTYGAENVGQAANLCICFVILSYVPDRENNSIISKQITIEMSSEWHQVSYISYQFPANTINTINWYHFCLCSCLPTLLNFLVVQVSSRKGEERRGAVGGNESLFCWDSWLPVHLGRDRKCSSCHKHSAFLSVPSITNTDGGRRGEEKKRQGSKTNKREKKGGKNRRENKRRSWLVISQLFLTVGTWTPSVHLMWEWNEKTLAQVHV